MQILEYSGEEFEHVSRDRYIPAIARMGPDFRGRVALQKLGEDLTLSRSHWGGPLSAVQTDRMAATGPRDDHMLFCVHLAGRGYVHQHDRVAELPAGSGVLFEARSPWKFVSTTEMRCLNIRFSRELLPLHTGEITEGCARMMDPAGPAMQILSGYLDRLFEAADHLAVPQRLDAGRAAIDLLAMALRDVTPSVPGGEGPEEVMLDMMRMHVREHLADPDLGVEELARRHHMSVSRIYTLFARIGTTPGTYLREQRLLTARTMLSDPSYARFTISRIAAAVGFRELTTFERAFRRHHGTTPASWRRERLRTPHSLSGGVGAGR
jgi:AraC-like DNA-binding protein